MDELNKLLDKHKVFIQKNVFDTSKKGTLIDVLRIDTIHQVVSGNKIFKLKLHLTDAIKMKLNTIATFGGAYSNHILATAFACNSLAVNSIGIIRGEKPAKMSDTLLESERLGMNLIFVSREEFRDKAKLKKGLDAPIYWVNEGGYSKLGAEGVKDMFEWIDESYTDIVCAVGTGTMMAGLIAGARINQKVTGICVLKGYEGATLDIENLLSQEDKTKNYKVLHQYHLGGYAKQNDLQITWMNNFYKQYKIPTDIVYTSKLFMAVEDLINNDYFINGSKVLIIHSGGLQGNNSINDERLNFYTNNKMI